MCLLGATAKQLMADFDKENLAKQIEHDNVVRASYSVRKSTKGRGFELIKGTRVVSWHVSKRAAVAERLSRVAAELVRK